MFTDMQLSNKFSVSVPSKRDESYLYRFHDSCYYDGHDGMRVNVFCETYKILSYTPRGCWVKAHDKPKRFVLNDAKKKYAYPDMLDAYRSYLHRKWSQRAILKAQLERCNRILDQEDAMETAVGQELLRQQEVREHAFIDLIRPGAVAA